MTNVIKQDYSYLVLAKSSTSFGILYTSAMALIRSAIFVPKIYGGLCRALRRAVPRSGIPTCTVRHPYLVLMVAILRHIYEDTIMINIIPISSRIITGKPTQCVNARKLHIFLESNQEYSNWIKNRISAYGFVQDEDFCLTKISSKGRGGHNAKDHFLTLDMAKELAMVERNEKGREARRYFIKCEKQLKQKQQPKALPASKQYNYPRKLLEQSGFITPSRPASLNISMLGNRNFVSPLMHLLNELRVDGHEVSAAWDEAIAMRDGVIHADEVLEKISLDAIRAYSKAASTASNK